MNDVFLPSIVVGLGSTGKNIVEGLYRNIQENILGKTKISFVSISSNHSSSGNGFAKIENNETLPLEFPSTKTSREKFLEDFRRSNVPNVLRDTVIYDFDKNASRSQIVLVASLGEIEAALIGDVLYQLHTNFTVENFTSFVCLSLISSLDGNRVRNEEMYAGLRELSRLGKYGYHIMGFPNEKIVPKSAYDFLFVFNDENNQIEVNNIDNSSISIQLFIENILKENNYQIRDNLFQAIRTSMAQTTNGETNLGDCLNSSLRTILNPTKKIKRYIANELLKYKLLNETPKADYILSPSSGINWNQVNEEIAEWFENDESLKSRELYSLIFKVNESKTVFNSETDLGLFIKGFQVCVHQGVENSLRKRTDRESFQTVENAVQLIIDQIKNQIDPSIFGSQKSVENQFQQRLFKELLKEIQDIAREIEEWIPLFNSSAIIPSIRFENMEVTRIGDVLENDLLDTRNELLKKNSVQIYSAEIDEIDLFISNFVRNSINGSNDKGKYLLESLNQYISVDAKNGAGFQIQLTTGSNTGQKKRFEPTQIHDFIQDCLEYLENNLDINPFTIDHRKTKLINHLNGAMLPSCKLVANSKINTRLHYSSYLVSRHGEDADEILGSVFTDTSDSAKTQIFDETSENEISAIRIFYDIPQDDIEKVNKLASDYYLDPALFIFQQERNAILIEKKLRNLNRGNNKVLLPGKVVDLLFDMDLVNKCLASFMLGILVKETDSNDQQYWKLNIQKTGRYMDPIICEAKSENLKELYSVLQEFSMVFPNEDRYRIEIANHFFYHENRQRFLLDLQNEIDRRKQESDIKEICGQFWKKIYDSKNSGSSIERGMKVLIIYEMLELLQSNYELKEIIGTGGLDELG